MLSPTSLTAFSGSMPPVGQSHGPAAARKVRAPGVDQPTPSPAAGARPGAEAGERAGPAGGGLPPRNLPRGTLLDLSV